MRKPKRLSRRYVARQHKIAKKRVKYLGGHPFIVPVISFLVFFFVGMVGLVAISGKTVGASDSHVVRLSVDGGAERTLPTRANSVKDLLSRLKINYAPEDVVEPKLDTPILEDNFKVNIYRARPVTVVDGSHKVTVLSAHQQPRLAAEQAGVKLFPEDGIKLDASQGITPDGIIGEKVVVDRATPASINLYGNVIPVRTRAKTVGDLLEQKNIKLLEGDTLQPARDTAITANTQIFVVRVGKQIVSEDVAIPAPVATENDSSLAIGSTVVKAEGADGKKIVTYELELQNGKEVSRKAIQEVIAAEPVRRVIAKGTKVLLTGSKEDWLIAAGVDPSEYGAADYVIGRESGWCPTKWQGEYGGCPAYHGAPSGGGVGYGLCQATPAGKMVTAGADWAVNPVTQLKWCTDYAVTRYGSWTRAYNFWSVNHWW